MSILLHHPTTSPAAYPRLGWSIADESFWVADDDGAFAGIIDRQGAHFFARNGFGEYLGDYRTLSAAQNAVADHVRRSRAAA